MKVAYAHLRPQTKDGHGTKTTVSLKYQYLFISKILIRGCDHLFPFL